MTDTNELNNEVADELNDKLNNDELNIVHKPVLLEECLKFLEPTSSDNLFVDGTLGEGGHTEAFLTRYAKLNAIGIDADSQIQEKAKKRLSSFGDRITFVNSWSDDFFRNYPEDLAKPDLILIDLGVSVFHYIESGRGFSFNSTEPLDMRLNNFSEINAADIVNSYNEKDLADLIFNFSEERYSRRIAAAIVSRRRDGRFSTSKELADCIFHAVPKNYRHGKIHPATKTFQALRIEVNGELARLPKLLELAFSTLRVGGRLGLISFHSLEDRIVKLYFRELAKNCTCSKNVPICKCGGIAKARLITRKAIKASDEEIKDNPPSRSARLRVVQKLHNI